MKKLLLVLAVVLFANVARAEGFGFCIGPKIGYQTTKLSLEKAEIRLSVGDAPALLITGTVSELYLDYDHSGAAQPDPAPA